MGMPFPDFVLFVVGVAASICAGWGYSMLGAPPNFRAARKLFWFSSLGFGSLGVVWASSGNDLPIYRLLVAGVLGAIAAVALAWVLWELESRERGLSAPPESLISTKVAVLPENSPTLVPALGTPAPPSPIITAPVPSPGNSSTLEKQRIFVDVSPEYLMAIYKDNMSFQADRIFADFVGKWMKLSGPIANISILGDESVSVTISSSKDILGLYFDTEWKERLSVLRKGAIINAECQIKEADSWTMKFEHCRLI
jgi:hypothetical protein